MGTVTPSCMTADELDLWSAANHEVGSKRHRAVSPCGDCPHSFALEMRAEGCCNGEPSVHHRVPDNSPAGLRRRLQKRDWQRRYRERQRVLSAVLGS